MAEEQHRDLLGQCALRGVDSQLREVVGFSAFVVVYKFDPGDSEWKSIDVEGTLFVYARSGRPSHNILVLNRLNPINFVEPISAQLTIQRQDPFLFYITPDCSLYCIWFRDGADCLRITYVIEAIKRQLMAITVGNEEWSDTNSLRPTVSAPDPANSPGANSTDKGRGKTSAPSRRPERGRSRIAARLCPPGNASVGPPTRAKKSDDKQEARSTTVEDENQTPKSVMDFFARAGFAPVNPQLRSRPGMSHRYADDSEGAAANPTVQQIVANPRHSLEQIEKEQMMTSSQRPQVNNSQQSTPSSSQKSKTVRNQRQRAVNHQNPKMPRPRSNNNNNNPKASRASRASNNQNQKTSKATNNPKPKEGESSKNSNPDAPNSLAEFLNKLKMSRSGYTRPEGKTDEIPNLLPMIPEPPVPDTAFVPRPSQPFPSLPGFIAPTEETFNFVPGPADASISGNSRPYPEVLPQPPPEQSALMQEAPAQLPSGQEPSTPAENLQEIPIQLAQAPEPPQLLQQSPQPPPPLSPTPNPPPPLASILERARSARPKPTLPKPLSLPKPHEPLFSPMFAHVKSGDRNDEAGASVAEENCGSASAIGNINDSDREGATAATNPPLHTQSRNLNAEILTREQLLQAINHLLRNDPTFIRKIHEAYLGYLNEKFP